MKKSKNKVIKPALYGMMSKAIADVYVIGYDLFKESLLTEEELQELLKMDDKLNKLNKKVKERL